MKKPCCRFSCTHFIDEKHHHTKGHLAFQQHSEGSIVTIKKAEVIEMPPTKK